MGTETQCLQSYMDLENIPGIAVLGKNPWVVCFLFFSLSMATVMRHPAAKAETNHPDDFCQDLDLFMHDAT